MKKDATPVRLAKEQSSGFRFNHILIYGVCIAIIFVFIATFCLFTN